MTETDSLILRDEEMFFRIVQTMPSAEEADELCRRARQACLRARNAAESRKEGRLVNDMQRIITRINDELLLIGQSREQTRTRAAVRAVFGDEGYARFVDYLTATDTRRANISKVKWPSP